MTCLELRAVQWFVCLFELSYGLSNGLSELSDCAPLTLLHLEHSQA